MLENLIIQLQSIRIKNSCNPDFLSFIKKSKHNNRSNNEPKVKIVLLTHPSFLESVSMPRYAKMIAAGMLQRGHQVIEWRPKARLYRLPFQSIKKWLGYLDQYVIFPWEVRYRLFFCSKKTLFVFTDHALGPWVLLVKNRPHVIHCHDFLAQQSALGTLPENKTGITGRFYQKFIRWGFKKGTNFISISQNTQRDLHTFLGRTPKLSKVIYNGLNQSFEPTEDLSRLRKKLSSDLSLDLKNGYILHVGGNQFYKNRLGVLEIYEQCNLDFGISLPLLLVSKKTTPELLEFKKTATASDCIHFLEAISNSELQALYQGAKVFLFPSLYEGFGWPIAEAMASGCLVITTNKAPMNEVGSKAAYYIDKKPTDVSQLGEWKKSASKILKEVIDLENKQRKKRIEIGLNQAKKFNTEACLDSMEMIYKEILNVK